MIEWANENSGFIMAVLTLVYVFATLVIVLVTMRANRIALASQQLQVRLEAQRTRPFVVVTFELVWDKQDQAHTYVLVKNTGLTLAEDVTVKIDPEPFYTPMINGRQEKKLPFMLTAPIPTLAPGQEISDTVGYTANLLKVVDKPVFDCVVTYRARSGEDFEELFVVDLESMRDAVPLRRRTCDA